jgi:hypothetical protein
MATCPRLRAALEVARVPESAVRFRAPVVVEPSGMFKYFKEIKVKMRKDFMAARQSVDLEGFWRLWGT